MGKKAQLLRIVHTPAAGSRRGNENGHANYGRRENPKHL